MKKQTVLNAVMIGGVLALAGCITGQGSSAVGSTAINEVTMSLPKQIKWVVSQNQKAENGSQVTEWVPKGYKSNNTPVRVIYQKLVPANKAQNITGQMVAGLKKGCNDTKVNSFKGGSTYPAQINTEVLCGQLGKNPVGIAMYSSIFTDKAANHVVISEIKTPAAKKAGVLNPKTAKEKEQAKNTAGLIQLMQGFMQTVRVCESKDKCM